MTNAASLATVAEYFRLGMLVGLLSPQDAVAWADSVVAATSVPPEGIIDVAWSKGVASAVDALAAVSGERNNQVAGRWLLGLLGQSIPESEEGLQRAVQRAMHIARYAELGDEVYYRFDRIDDELSLARTGAYGTVEQCRAALVSEFSLYKPIEGERVA